MKNFPVEVQLDILKFLDYQQLYSFQLINKQLNNLIGKYNNELALKGFFSFEIIPDTKVVLSECKRASNIAKDFEKLCGNEIIYNMELNDCQKIKWQHILTSKIPVFWSSDFNVNNRTQYDFGSCVLFIKRNCSYNRQVQPHNCPLMPFKLHDLSSDQVKRNKMLRRQQERVVEAHLQLNVQRYQQLCLELPIYPKTLEELKFIRFWLWQLSRCCFREIDFDKIIFNPEMLKLIFEDSDQQNQKIQFFGNNIFLNINNRNFDNLNIIKHENSYLEFAFNHLNLTGCLMLSNIQTFQDKLLNFW